MATERGLEQPRAYGVLIGVHQGDGGSDPLDRPTRIVL